MNRFQIALWGAILAWGIAYDLGVPPWRDWVPGDCFDIAACTFALLWYASPRSKREAPRLQARPEGRERD